MYIYLFSFFIWFFRKSALERFITQRCIMYRGQFFTRLRFFLERSQLETFFQLYLFLISFLFWRVGYFREVVSHHQLISDVKIFFRFYLHFEILFIVKRTFGIWGNFSCWGFVIFLFFIPHFHLFKKGNIFEECYDTR